jgi:hypothetical protein
MSLRIPPFRIGLILLASIVLSGCDQGRERPPSVSVRVANAAPSFSAIAFTREQAQREASEVGYRGAAGAFTYDQDQYDFHFDFLLPGATTAERRSFSKEIVAEMQYMFVAAEVGGLVEPVILEYPALANTDTQAQIVALHAGTSLPAMDLYVEPAGTTVATAIPKASLAFGQSFAPLLIAPGSYELTLTEPGNSANVLLASSTFTLTAAASTVFIVVDGADEGIAPLRVMLLQDTVGSLIDKNSQSGLRVINGATDTGARDVALNGQFTPPLYPAVPFATRSAFELVPPGDNTVDVTPAGNPGVLELTQTITVAAGAKQTLLFTGDAGTLTHLLVADDERRVAAQAKVRFLNLARQFTQVDFLIVEVGADATSLAPTSTLPVPGGTPLTGLPPGSYELVLRENGTTNLIAGPLPITLAAGGLYSVLATNGADAATANIVLLDDF